MRLARESEFDYLELKRRIDLEVGAEIASRTQGTKTADSVGE